jgi:putative SOS response-associated peptidase YedK
MCGRVTTFFNYEDIEMSFDAVASFEEFMGYNPEEIEAQYNAGPGSKLPIVLQGEQNRLISKAVFGYSPAMGN